jgi:hypothetical protein
VCSPAERGLFRVRIGLVEVDMYRVERWMRQCEAVAARVR